MWKLKTHLLISLLIWGFGFASSAASKSSRERHEESAEIRASSLKLKRQSGFPSSFPSPSSPSSSGYYSNSGGSRYEPIRGNGLAYATNNFRNDRDRDRDYYYPAASTYSGRSGSSSPYNTYREQEYVRDHHYRQPYYDDYRERDRYGNYQSGRDREEAAAQNMEFIMRTGQQRHAEYQKRVGQAGQETYDPFYFIGIRSKQTNTDVTSVPLSPVPGSSSSISSDSQFPSPSNPTLSSPSTDASHPNPNGSNPPTSSSSAPGNHPLRNRRNSHQPRYNDFNDINEDKYDIMNGKSAHPPLQRSSNLPHHHYRWPNHNQNRNPHNNNHDHRQAQRKHPFDQQFLTREQLLRHPDSRVNYPPHNHLERYSSGDGPGQPWSIQIGTQLKVNDDGRAPNPHRFYVRDETQSDRNRSRYPPRGPIYRRK